MSARSTQPAGLAREIGKRSPFASDAQEAFLNLVRTCEHLEAGFAQLFKRHGVTASQYNALRILRGHDRPTRTYEVAADMVTREPDITRLLERLADAGLVTRCRCAEDRRVVWVELAPGGRALLKRLDQPVVDLHAAQLGHLGPRRLRTLNRLLCAARGSC